MDLNILKDIIVKKDLPFSKLRSKYIDVISGWLDRKEIIILKGIRRCGKTNIMYQLMSLLPKENVFYVNLDDFRFQSELSLDFLDKIINLRNKKKKAYFFLDEIQNISGFESVLKTYYDLELPIKFIIGGSNISLLSKELGTVLTGRNITFQINTLSYDEYKNFSGKSFEDYLIYGGFPEVVLEKDETRKVMLLQQYIDDIISKDIIQKNNVENIRQIKNLTKFFLSNPGIMISANKLSNQIGINKETAQKYLKYLIDTFLVFEVPYFSYSLKTKYIGNRASKYYVIDNGLYTVSSFKKNIGSLYENCVAISIKEKNPMYWCENSEIDFVYDKFAIQVTSENKIPLREKKAFIDFSKKHFNYTNILISKQTRKDSISIEDFLLQNEICNI